MYIIENVNITLQIIPSTYLKFFYQNMKLFLQLIQLGAYFVIYFVHLKENVLRYGL